MLCSSEVKGLAMLVGHNRAEIQGICHWIFAGV